MIKLILLLSIFSACGFLGINISKTYTDKHKFYKELLLLCQNLKTDISFLKTDIVSILQKNKYETKLNAILIDIVNLLNNNTLLQKNDIFNLLNKYHFLTEQDKNFLVSIFYEIGSMGYDEELARIEYNIIISQTLLEDYKQNKLKFAGLSKKMGFLCGLLVCIVLI